MRRRRARRTKRLSRGRFRFELEIRARVPGHEEIHITQFENLGRLDDLTKDHAKRVGR